jgi:dihydrofolate synthase/folylpolyglutamate synthase
MRLGLEPMRAACARLGHPERAFEAVHVAGTNGKGSVSAMVERIARAAGKRTGLYTSPHLCRFAERIRINGEPIADDVLAPLLTRILRETPELSFFETATLTAFVAFREAGVELAVIEVGIGGRLDATNVLPTPRAAAITRIALDHMDRLGPTLVDIAREKAGIAKRGLQIVLGPVDPPVRGAIDEVARQAGATTLAADEDPEAVRFAEHATIGLAGDHQRGNAKVAWLLGRLLGIDERARAEGIAEARWPGRLERLDTAYGPVLLDGAHNPDGADALARHLDAIGANPAATVLVFGALADKDWQPMLDRLAPCAERRIYVPPHSPGKPAAPGGARGATEPAQMAARHPGSVAETVREALALASSPTRPSLIVICGSMFLIGEARALLLGLARDPAVAL